LYQRCGGDGTPEPVDTFFFGALPLPVAWLGPANPLYWLRLPQWKLERGLAERATQLGVEERRGPRVTGVEPLDDRVCDTTKTDDGDAALEARYLVGCDGAHSVVRKQAGIDFPGITNDSLISRAAIVRMTEDLRAHPAVQKALDEPGELATNFYHTE